MFGICSACTTFVVNVNVIVMHAPHIQQTLSGDWSCNLHILVVDGNGYNEKCWVKDI